MIDVPEDAGWYGWEAFVRYCRKSGIECDLVENEWDDIKDWWACWKAGYCSAMNTG